MFNLIVKIHGASGGRHRASGRASSYCSFIRGGEWGALLGAGSLLVWGSKLLCWGGVGLTLLLAPLYSLGDVAYVTHVTQNVDKVARKIQPPQSPHVPAVPHVPHVLSLQLSNDVAEGVAVIKAVKAGDGKVGTRTFLAQVRAPNKPTANTATRDNGARKATVATQSSASLAGSAGAKEAPVPAPPPNNTSPSTTSNAKPSATQEVTQEAAPEAQAVKEDFYRDPFTETAEQPSFLALWLRLMGILLLFGLGAYLLLRFMKARQHKQEQTHPLCQTIASFPLTVNKTIKIIKIINDYFVVIVTQENVTVLKQLEDKASLDELKLYESSSKAATEPLFGAIFKRYTTLEPQAPLSITRALREKLKKL